jgi:hypothetical protein
MLAAQLHLLQGVERVGAGLGAHDAEVLAVLPPQVAGDSARHPDVVVHRHDARSRRASGGEIHVGHGAIQLPRARCRTGRACGRSTVRLT